MKNITSKIILGSLQNASKTAANTDDFGAGGNIEKKLSHLFCIELAKLAGLDKVVLREDEFTFRDFLRADLNKLSSSKLENEAIYSHLGATDIIVDDLTYLNAAQESATCIDKKVAWKNSIGIELKFFDCGPAPEFAHLQVDYFTNDFDPNGERYTSKDVVGKKENFIQQGHLTYCKHGQLLYDYCKAIKILQCPSYAHNEFYLCGIVCVHVDWKGNVKLIQNQINKLFTYFIKQGHPSGAELYNFNQNGKIRLFAEITQFPSTPPKVIVDRVYLCHDKVSRKVVASYIPFFVTITK